MNLSWKIGSCFLFLFAASIQGAISGPLSGYVFDPSTNAIRQIIGVPGAAYLGDAAIGSIDFASIAPNGFTAFVIADHKGGLIQNLSSSPAIIPLAHIETLPGKFTWALDSSAFLMTQSDNSTVLMVHSVSETPTAEVLDLSPCGGTPSALAVSAFPNLAAISVRNGNTDGVYIVTPGTKPLLALPLRDVTALVFSSNRSTVYAATAGQSPRVIRISGVMDSSPSAFSVPLPKGELEDENAGAVSSSAVADFTGLVLDSTETTIYAFRDSPSAVTGFSLKNRGITFSALLDTTASNISAGNISSTILLNPVRDKAEPVLYLELTGNPRVLFVPAPIGSN